MDDGVTSPGSVSVADLADRVRAGEPRLGGVRLVCVDGPAGSGKTTLAGRLVAALAPVVDGIVLHMDDLYEGWSGLEGDLLTRLQGQVLDPLERGVAGRYQRYDWVAGRFGEWVDVPVPQVLVLEGCGSGQRPIAQHASLLAFVEAPAHVRLRRGLDRDGEQMREQWLRWMGLEAVHLSREATRERAEVLVDGTRELLA